MAASVQDWAQLDETYGKDAARTLLGCFRKYLIFGGSNALNTDKSSEMLGKHQVERIQIIMNAAGGAGGGGGGRSRNLVTSPPEPVVMYSEISFLKEPEGHVMFGEDFPIAKLTPATSACIETKSRTSSIRIVRQQSRLSEGGAPMLNVTPIRGNNQYAVLITFRRQKTITPRRIPASGRAKDTGRNA